MWCLLFGFAFGSLFYFLLESHYHKEWNKTFSCNFALLNDYIYVFLSWRMYLHWGCQWSLSRQMEHCVSVQCILLLKTSAQYIFIGQHRRINTYFHVLDTIYLFGGSPVTAVICVHQKWTCFLAACSLSLEGMMDLTVSFVLLHIMQEFAVTGHLLCTLTGT